MSADLVERVLTLESENRRLRERLAEIERWLDEEVEAWRLGAHRVPNPPEE